MAPTIATARRVERPELLDFIRPRHRATLVTTRNDGAPQLSLITYGVDDAGRVVISTYPERAKATLALCCGFAFEALVALWFLFATRGHGARLFAGFRWR